MRSRDQVHQYLLAKLQEEMPPDKVQGVQTAYRMFGLLPDSLDLGRLLLDLYTEQVAGFYDPDSTMLFGVTGVDPTQLKLVVAHELVHALQDQYTPLDSIMRQKDDNDRLGAAQAILEGQATLASIQVIAPDQDVIENEAFWDAFREQIAAQQSSMKVFADAPLVLREGLIFPYLGGAEFMRWWALSGPNDTVPYGPRMPVSTEQIMHPERYARGDVPLAVRFAESGDSVMYEDVLGELGLRILETDLTGINTLGSTVPAGWGGDRFRMYDTAGGPALVWYAVWDDDRARSRFLSRTGARLAGRSQPGYRSRVDHLTIDGRPATRWIFAPAAWSGWTHPPIAHLASAGGPG